LSQKEKENSLKAGRKSWRKPRHWKVHVYSGEVRKHACWKKPEKTPNDRLRVNQKPGQAGSERQGRLVNWAGSALKEPLIHKDQRGTPGKTSVMLSCPPQYPGNLIYTVTTESIQMSSFQ
jgi:hypothetical protein